MGKNVQKNPLFFSKIGFFPTFADQLHPPARRGLTKRDLGDGTYPSLNVRSLFPNPTHTVDLKQIKQIIDLMKRSELTEFAVEEEGFKLKIRRGLNGLPIVSQSRGSNPPFQVSEASAPSATAAPFPVAAPAAPTEEAGIIYVKSPMVGTFYRSPSPESKPFIEPGAKLTETSVVCIIEAMKIMNEIQSEVKGTVLEIMVENGQPVEYGQRLYKVKQG